MTDQGQLWNAGPVKIQYGTWDQKKWDQRKVADGRNKRRMQRRQAANLGMSVPEYLRHREQQRAEAALRRAERRAPKDPLTKTCLICGSSFETQRSTQLLCGNDDCRRKYQSSQVSKSIMRRYYSDPDYRDGIIAASASRRAEKLGLGDRRITVAYLLERDNWRCGICGKKIRKREDASLDHIIPLKPVSGPAGTHTLENVQASHLKCNYAKGNRGGGEQLLIIG